MPSLWVALLETKCYFWQFEQMREHRRGEKMTVAVFELWQPSSMGLLCIQRAPPFCVSAGQEKHLTWHLEMLRDSLWRPEGGRKEPMMLSQTCVLNARKGALPQSFGHRDKKRITRPSGLAPLAPVLGLTLSFVWNGFISFLSDMIF